MAVSWIIGHQDLLRDWWLGQTAKDGNGNRVQIGGGRYNLVNPTGNAMTMDGTIYVRDRKTFERYANDPDWQDHEEGHIAQGMGGKLLLSYAGLWYPAAMYELFTPGTESTGGLLGHDFIYWEQDAERYKREKRGF